MGECPADLTWGSDWVCLVSVCGVLSLCWCETVASLWPQSHCEHSQLCAGFQPATQAFLSRVLLFMSPGSACMYSLT